MYRQWQAVTRADYYWSMLPKSQLGDFTVFAWPQVGCWRYIYSHHMSDTAPLPPTWAVITTFPLHPPFIGGVDFQTLYSIFPNAKSPLFTTLWLEESAA
jgi:hypothetical protein